MTYTVTITFMDGSTRQRKYTSKREALAEERKALQSRIVLCVNTKGETA